MSFQFHKGTIRTFAPAPIAEPIHYFNSIKVRLELESAYQWNPVLEYFNSIKVRLEHTTDKIEIEQIAHFNSIKVRLEPLAADSSPY